MFAKPCCGCSAVCLSVYALGPVRVRFFLRLFGEVGCGGPVVLCWLGRVSAPFLWVGSRLPTCLHVSVT